MVARQQRGPNSSFELDGKPRSRVAHLVADVTTEVLAEVVQYDNLPPRLLRRECVGRGRHQSSNQLFHLLLRHAMRCTSPACSRLRGVFNIRISKLKYTFRSVLRRLLVETVTWYWQQQSMNQTSREMIDQLVPKMILQMHLSIHLTYYSFFRS